ncbi:MFS transporter [Streptomyces sp. NPDC053427]|uniref:MFS transporter n=1 Tax=Streptomyces sp. NPDC053427 TaxID=3365701 RepID=UPI0037D8949F
MITRAVARRAAASEARPSGRPRNGTRGGLQLLVLALGFVMASLDTGIMNVAADDLRTHLGLTMSSLTWVVDGYVLAFAALLLAGSLANRFGARRIHLIGLAAVTAASLLGAVAPDGTALVAARFAQGVGATLNANRRIGSLVGIAGMGAVLTGAGDGYRGAALAFGLTAGASAAAAVVGWRGVRGRA